MKVKELPEAELVRRTFIVREVDLPPETRLTKRSLLRWMALSLGLISERESRDTVLDVLDAVFLLCLKKKKNPTTLELQQFIKSKSRRTIHEKLIRYHLNRLIELGILRRKNLRYSFNPAPNADRQDLRATVDLYVSASLQKTLKNLGEAVELLGNKYKK